MHWPLHPYRRREPGVVGTAVDNADNSVSTTVGPINVDETDPVITVASRTPANDEGWNAGPVAVTFACDDGSNADDSGVASLTAPQMVGGDGIHSVTGTCLDKAGNSASITVFDVKIDSQKPTIVGSATPGPNGNGWNDSDVATSFTCSDNPGGSASGRTPSSARPSPQRGWGCPSRTPAPAPIMRGTSRTP